jgi:hypothetical protein
MASLLSRSPLSITLISGAFIMGATTVISPLPSASALARPHAVPQTCVLMVPSTGQDDNPSRQDKAINVCIPTADIPLGMPSAAAQPGASDRQTVGAKTGYRTVGKFSFKVAFVARFNCTGTVLTADDKKPALVLVAALRLQSPLRFRPARRQKAWRQRNRFRNWLRRLEYRRAEDH